MARPRLEHIPTNQGRAFVYKLDRDLWQVYHFHREVDILLVLKNRGEFVSGDYIGELRPGTLIMNGPNIPHALHTRDPDERDWSRPALAALLFSPETLGPELLQKEELSLIAAFLEEAKRGFEFFGETRDRAHELIMAMTEQDDLERFVSLLRLLRLLADSDERTPLASMAYSPSLNERDIDRVSTVIEYLQAHKGEAISLEEVARQVNLAPKSFCRFFKANTGKTLVQYLNEIRVAEACKQLLESDAAITEICFASGFNNVANFNRRFRRIRGLSPREFRRRARLEGQTGWRPMPAQRSDGMAGVDPA